MEVLLSYLSDRIYIFLLCNGILVFLFTRSGLIIGKPPLAILIKENSIKAFRRLELELSDREDAITQEAKEAEEKKGEEEERKQNEILVVTNKENEYLLLVKKLDDAEEQDQEEENFDATEENQQGQEEEDEEEEDFDDTEENQEGREEDEEDFNDPEDHQDEQEEGDFDDTQEYEEEDFDDTEENQEEEDGGIELLSLQELNLKCDNFIKFMREGIQIRVKKLVMV